MYYSSIYEQVQRAAKANGEVSVEAMLKRHGISRTTYYRHLKEGTPWSLRDIKALGKVLKKSPAEVLEDIDEDETE